jgi:phage recombination protein Bet
MKPETENNEGAIIESPKPKKAGSKTALTLMAERLAVEPSGLLDTLRKSIFPGVKNEEMLALVAIANRYQLDPLTRQIYAMPKKGGGVQAVVSVDGWLAVVNSHPAMDGMEFDAVEDEDGELVGMTCRIYRSDRARPVSVTEYLAECARKTEPWATSPRRMLRHKALIQCARYAFGICGIADPDEAETIAAPRRASVTIDPYDPAQLPQGAIVETKGEDLF